MARWGDVGAVIAAFALSACSTTNAMSGIINSWKGEPISAVSAQWGLPDSERTILGQHLYRWSNRGVATVPGVTYTSGTIVGGRLSTVSTTTGGGTFEFTCDIELAVDQSQLVTGGQWRGNDCCVMTVSGFCGSLPNKRRGFAK